MAGGDGAAWRVFVSHTSELRKFPVGESYVAAVERAISACGHVVVDMADFPAADQASAQFCEEKVRSCGVYLGVLGTRYGSPVRDRPELSYTELEFETAGEAGLDRLVFVLDTEAEDVGIPAKGLIDLEYGARQQAFRRRVLESDLTVKEFSSPAVLGQLVERSLRDLAGRRAASADLSGLKAIAGLDLGDAPGRSPADLLALLNAHFGLQPAQSAVGQAADQGEDLRKRLRAYLDVLAESYRWLELQGIREAGSLQIELEKVYVALKAEPESDYDLRHLANLHMLEVREAAGGASLDSIEPARLAELEAENVRRTYQPRRDEARQVDLKGARNIADAFRLKHRMVLLGGPGSGKTTLGHWLALQLARGLIRQLPREVAPEAEPDLPNVSRVHVSSGAASPFSKHHFFPADQVDKNNAIRIDALPERGRLALFGTPVTVNQVIGADQIERLTFTPVSDECGSCYAHLQFSVGGDRAARVSGAVVVDVGEHIRVPVSQVDPDRQGEEDREQFVALGPARVPIFLRLAHFARELAERERGQKPPLSLEEFLGRDPDSCGRADGCTADSRNDLLRQFLGSGNAVVILDGLDELPEANRRTVSLKIQDFIEKNTEPNASSDSGGPWLAGGNQVIVTSRYVGYKLMPIRAGCVHFGIQAMQRPAVEHFARAWTAAVNAELGADADGRLFADDLIAEIYDDSRPAIRELATNPLLVTILATVYWADGQLPDQRAGVYDRVVENLLRIWLSRPECRARSLGREELLAALEPLAAEMQDNRAGNGLIGLDRIGELIEAPLALMRRSDPSDRAFRPVLDALLTTIRRHVGLLAEQSPGNYAFFHRTFQEFLAARYLLADREHAADKIVERLDDPHWREPLLLALGLAMISPEWGGPRTRTGLLEDVLAGDDRDPLIPRAAMLMVNALPDLKNVPRQVVGRVAKQLLTCYAFSQDQSQAEGLREGICEAFVQLRNGPQCDIVSEAIAAAIRQPPADRDCSAAAAAVLLRIDWFTNETVDALLQVVHRDQAALGWPVRWALLAALGQPAGDLPWARPVPALNTARLLATHLPMRRLLESSPELTAFVRADVGWLWLLIALYGGVGHIHVLERLGLYQRQCLRIVRATDDDPDQDQTAGPPPPVPPIEFSPGDIVHDLADAELSRTVQRYLRMRKPSAGLAETFRQVWERDADPAASAEAMIGLAALGEDVVPRIRDALHDPDRQSSAQAALVRFRWLRALLREPLLRLTEPAARTLPDDAPEGHQLDLLRIVIEARAASGAGPLRVGDLIASGRLVEATSVRVRDALDAEYLGYVCSGLPAEGLGRGSPAGTDLRSDARLIRGWSELSQSRNLQTRYRLPWPQMPLAPRPETSVEYYLAMLEDLGSAPAEYDYRLGRLLGQYRSLLTDHPALIWETVAICCFRGPGFTLGYITGATGDRVFSSGCSSVASDFASTWAACSPHQVDVDDLRLMLTNIFLQRAGVAPERGEAAFAASLAVLIEASRIADPFLRFRAVLQLFDTVRREQLVPLRLNIGSLVEEITDPHDHARALEWLIMTIPAKQAGLGVSDVFDLARLARRFARIADPENRARAQCRLALLAPEQLEDLLEAAAESVGQIVDPARKAEAISEICAVMGGVASLVGGFDSAADSLTDPWLRDKALGRASRLIAAYRLHYGAGELAWRLPPDVAIIGATSFRLSYPTGHFAWGVLYLNATAAEAAALEATPTGNNADWELLLGPELQAGLDSLVESAAEAGLRITAREASVLNRVIQADRAAALKPLWAYLDSPDLGALAMAVRWAAGDPDAARWTALVQVEAGQLTAENVASVVELAGSPIDRLRLRAGLALHGPTPYTSNPHRRWSTGRVGPAIEALAWHATRTEYPPPVLNSLSWVACDIHHDDAELLRHWLSKAAADSDSPAHWILKHLESMDGSLVPTLLEAIPDAPPELKETLLFGLARLAHCSTVLYGTEDSLHEAVSTIPVEIRQKLRVVPDGAVAYLKVAEQVASLPGQESRLAAARSMMAYSMSWLDDVCLLDGKSCLSRLRHVGNGLYITLGPESYWVKAQEAAVPLAENENALRLMLSWVESLGLAQDSAASIGDLLTAIEALARVSPNAFTTLADPDIWEPMLTEWAESSDHWTARLAAIRLLGLLRRVTERVAAAFRAAMNDVSFVQQAAYRSVGEFRNMRGDIIPELLDLLNDPSADVAASTTRLLVSLASGEGATADRRRILRGLQDAVAKSPKSDPVYLMRESESSGPMSIQYVDRLDRILYRAIFEVSGL